jgi:hypothetical protein
VRGVRPYPLLMVGLYAFMLALNAFALVLLSQYTQPAWLWGLNAFVMASEVVAAVGCYQRAKSE